MLWEVCKELCFPSGSLNCLQFGKLQGNTGSCSDTKCDNLYRKYAISFTDSSNVPQGVRKLIPKPVSW